MKVTTRLWTALAVLLLFAVLVAPIQASGPNTDEPSTAPKSDNRPDPLTDRQLELRDQALQAKLNGKAKGKTHEVAQGQYVQLEQDSSRAIWTVLGEFSDIKHNQIPQPDRAVNNSTLWVSDFNRQHYEDMFFNQTPGANSLYNFYVEQSSGRFAPTGDVTDWIQLPKPAASYDDNDNNDVWNFIRDEVNGWYDQQIAKGQTPDQINAYLSKFDQWDRYDYNGNGNFDEPDGYIDTFQAVHAGEGEEAGAPAWMIWSHSWYAFQNLIGKDGPDFNKYGGTRIGNSNYWVGKYTVQPENGGVGVFAHEFGHDLGLPDLYDTAGGDNGTAFWTLMSSGSWLGDGTQDIGSKPNHMGAWEKLQLGWLNYEVASSSQKAEFKLGPSMANTKQAQAVIVTLPKKSVTTNVGTPFAGTKYYYSGSGDNLDYFMSKSFNLPASATLSAKVKYNIEKDWDYAYLVYSTDSGATWTPIQTNLSVTTDPNGQNKGFGITGVKSSWTTLTANLPAGNVLLGFRYWTDANTGGFGFMVDDINITGQATDGAETDASWTFKPTTGFHVTTGTENRLYSHYYVAEYRTYKGYDATLQTGPYNFGWTTDPVLFNQVEHFPYQDGLLINYWDTSQRNNNTIQHPGLGLVLPIDAHPAAMMRPSGSTTVPLRNRIQSYDATFGLTDTTPLTLHFYGVEQKYPSLKAVSVFNDNNTYYDPVNKLGSVNNPHTGTQIRIQSISAQDSFMQIEVRLAK